MLSPMFGHRPRHKKFNLPFRHYDPQDDERRKKRLKIKRPYKKSHQTRSVILLSLGLVFVIWVITLL